MLSRFMLRKNSQLGLCREVTTVLRLICVLGRRTGHTVYYLKPLWMILNSRTVGGLTVYCLQAGMDYLSFKTQFNGQTVGGLTLYGVDTFNT